MLKQWLKVALAQAGVDCRFNRYADPLRLQRELVQADCPVVFDIGAHHGLTYSAYRHAFPTAQIHAFEPFEESLVHLRKAAANDQACTIHPLALSDIEGSHSLHVNQASATNSLKPLTESASTEWETARLIALESHSVPVRTLDSICNELHLDRIDVMKMDVQGAEYQVLRGAKKMLSKAAIGLLQMEHILARTYADQHSLSDYLTFMSNHGYRVIDFYQPLRRRGQLLQFDILFASPDIPAI